MDASLFRKAVELAGLYIDKSGIVYFGQGYSRKEYAILLSLTEEVLLIDDSKIFLKDIISITYIEKLTQATIVLVNGAEVPLVHGTFTVAQRVLAQASTVNAVMPKMDSELNDLFPMLYPDFKNKAYYDEMIECEMIDLSLFDSSCVPGKFEKLDDNAMYAYYDSIERRLKSVGCTGTPPSTQIRQRSLLLNLSKQKRNRFKEWVLMHPWDGKPRVDRWFQNVFGATAPPLRDYKVEDIYLATVSRAWFAGAIRRMFLETSHEIVPVLIGKQGDCKKTSGLKYTAGRDEWAVSTTIDVSSKDGIAKFLDAVRGKIVVELAESNTIRSANQEILKAFISNPSDQYRKPYAHREQSWPRHFIMAASSNLDDVFTDITGNRRYYPMYCNPPDLSYRTPENVQQVWAEAYQMYLRGQPTYIDSAWMPALIMQKFTTVVNNNIESIDNWLNDPVNGFALKGALVTKGQFMKLAYNIDYSSPVPEGYERAFRAWAQGTQYWQKHPYPVKVDGKSQRAYVRMEDSPELTNLMQKSTAEKNMTDREYESISAGIEDAIKMEEAHKEMMAMTDIKDIARCIYNNVCRERGIVGPGEYFPVDGISLNIIVVMRDEGLIATTDMGTYVSMVAV